MKEFQPYIQPLDDITFTHATTQNAQTIQLKALEKRIYNGEIAHLQALILELEITPTFTTAPTLIGLNAALSDIEFYDGSDMLFKGTGNDCRQFERIEHGGPPIGEPVTQTSTNPRYITRQIPIGPARMAGSPSDFSMACAEFVEGGYIKFTPGVLTDVSADTTVCTTVLRTYAVLSPSKGRVRLAAKYQRLVKPNTGSGLALSDESLIAFLALQKTTYLTFAVGDVGKIEVKTAGLGRFVPNVHASGLSRCYQSAFRRGSVDQVKGEQRNDTFDVAPRIVNFASATALAAQAADLQPILWTPPDATLSKVRAAVKKGDQLTITYSGSQGATGSSYLLGRWLPNTQQSIATRTKRVATALGLSSGATSENQLGAKPFGNQVNPQYGSYDLQVSG